MSMMPTTKRRRNLPAPFGLACVTVRARVDDGRDDRNVSPLLDRSAAHKSKSIYPQMKEVAGLY
jgi:hypothetical protein